MVNKTKSNIPAIVVMFALFFMIAFVTNLAGSMGVILKQQFNASDAFSQFGSLANFLAYACMGIPAGLMLKRRGYKVTALSAVAVGFIGVGIQFLSGYAPSGSLVIYLVGAFVAGLSMCMLNIVVNPLLNTLGGGGNRGNQLIQFGGSCNSIGGTLAPVLAGYFIGEQVKDAVVNDVAPVMIIALVIFAVAFLVICLTSIPEPHMESAEEKAARKAGNVVKNSHSPLSFRHFVLGAIAIFIYVGVEVGTPNMANIYMSQLEGVGPVVAGAVVGAYWFLMMCGRLIGGLIGGKVSSRAMLISVCLLASISVLCILFIPSDSRIQFSLISDSAMPTGMLFAAFCGLCTSVMWGSIFNLSTEGLGKYTSMASGIFMTMVCGGGIIPAFQGWISDKVGYINSYYVILAGFIYILLFGLYGYRNVNKDIKVD